MNMKRTHVLLWSQSQNALHVETSNEMYKKNCDAFAQNRRMDYVPIFFGDEDECREAAHAFRHILMNRRGQS